MPIYEYEPDSGECDICQGRFESLQKRTEPRHERCPTCDKPCHQVLSTVAAHKSENALLSDKNVAEKGFTKYRNMGDGRYEKVAGDDGPEMI